MEVVVAGRKPHHLLRVAAVGVLLKGGASHADVAHNVLHQVLDKFGGAVAHNDVVLMDVEVLSRQQAVDRHTRGVLADDGVKRSLDLVEQTLRREVRIHQVAEILHVRITPVAAVATRHRAPLSFRAFGEHTLGDVEVLNVVDLIPFLARERERLESSVAQQSDNPEHLLVVLVATQGGAVGVEERHILRSRELAAKLVDIHRLVVVGDVAVSKLLLVEEVDDILILVEGHHRAVHPALILVHQSQVRARVSKQLFHHATLIDKVRLQQQRVVLNHIVASQVKRVNVVGFVIDRVVDIDNFGALVVVADILHHLVAIVTYDDDDPIEVESRQTVERAVDETHAVDFQHTFSVILSQFTKTTAHTSGQNYSLHFYINFIKKKSIPVAVARQQKPKLRGKKHIFDNRHPNLAQPTSRP